MHAWDAACLAPFLSSRHPRGCAAPRIFILWYTAKSPLALQEKGGRKQPYYIHLSSGEPLVMAGLWDVWQSADSPVHTYTILTTGERARRWPAGWLGGGPGCQRPGTARTPWGSPACGVDRQALDITAEPCVTAWVPGLPPARLCRATCLTAAPRCLLPDASKRLEWLHDRMPVILRDREAQQTWLRTDDKATLG